MLNLNVKNNLEKQGYRFTGEHSVVKICHWTRKSLTDKGYCYKQKFYGIPSHQCCQMSPSIFCNNKCVFCWRDTTICNQIKIKKIDEPEEIIDNCIKMQEHLLNGFPGNEKINMKKFNESKRIKNFAISAVGEPTIYPKLSNMLEELHKRKITSFLVTNGTFPEKINNLSTLPTQLYVSLDAPNKKLYGQIDQPSIKNSWEKFNKTLSLLKDLKTRKTLRLTLIKDFNMCNEEEYAELINKAEPDFVEVKAYMFLGNSRHNLKFSNMPSHKEVKDFAEKLSKLTSIKVKDEQKESRVVLLSNKNPRL